MKSLLELAEFVLRDLFFFIQNLSHRVSHRRKRREKCERAHLLCPLDLGDIMHQHALDARFQRHSARVAPATAALQLDLHDSIVRETAILNVPAILHDRGPDARIQQLLDHRDRIRVRLQNPRVLPRAARLRPVLFRTEERQGLHGTGRRRRGRGRGGEVFHQDRVHLRFDHRPRVALPPLLRHGDKVGPVEDTFDALDAEEPQGEGRRQRRARVEEFGRARLHHGRAGDELERVLVRRRLCLYEHGPACTHTRVVRRVGSGQRIMDVWGDRHTHGRVKATWIKCRRARSDATTNSSAGEGVPTMMTC